jgi:aminoglycoside phosphotransferase (APT) family kinase protein
VVVDFDEMRLGDPAFDVAHFCVYLQVLALRRHGSLGALAAAEARFLATYAGASVRVLDRQLVAGFRAYTCLKVAKQLVRGTGVRPRPDGDDMIRQLRAVLEHGQRSLEVE